VAQRFPSPADSAAPFARFEEVSDGLESWALHACEAMDRESLRGLIVARCLNVFESEVADEAFAQFLGMSVAENLEALTQLICGKTDLSRLTLAQPLSFASLQAQLRVPQPDLQRSYRVSFLTIWDEMTTWVDTQGRLGGVGADERAKVVQFLTRAIYTYHDFVTSRVAENYTRVESTLSQSRARLRQQLLREILREGADPLPPAELALLEYDLRLHHVAVALPGSASEMGERLLRESRSRGLSREGLVFSRGLTSTVVWLGSSRPWDDAAISRVRDMLDDLGLVAMLSSGHPGVEGLGISLSEADQVLALVGSHPGLFGTAPVRYSDVMLDLLLLRDVRLAKDFVRRTLGPLAAETPEAARLCETVSTWMRHGSHVGAAEDLGVHEQTVRNRLARAETLIGGGLRARRTEVEVALRLRRLIAEHEGGET
jgi:hypothetical protein